MNPTAPLRLALFFLLPLTVPGTLLLAQDEYRLDDGVKESSWGASSQGTAAVSFAWLNKFVVEPDKEIITAVNLAFGHREPTFGASVANDTPVRVYIWYDIHQDGDPATSVVVAEGSGLVENSGTNQFTSYDLLQPVTLPVGHIFYAGAIIDNLPNPPPPHFIHVASLDEDGTDEPPFYLPNQHSFVAANSNGVPVNADALGMAQAPVKLVEDAFPLPTCPMCSGDGNWMIRLNASSAAGITAPVLTISPPLIDFIVAPTNEPGPAHFTTLFNTGTGLLQIQDISPPTPGSGFTGPNPFQPGACDPPPFTLASGGSCRLYYALNPQDTIAYIDSIVVDSNTTAPPPPPIDLIGDGVEVLVGLGAPLVDFGAVQIGSTAVAYLEIVNVDNGHPSGLGFPLRVDNLDSLAHGGLPPFLTVEPGTCGQFTFFVDYLQSCQLEFRFTPSDDSSFAHFDEVFTNTVGVTNFVVEGFGVPSAPPVLQLEPAPDPIDGAVLVDFGQVFQHTIAGPLKVRLTNTGGSDLEFAVPTNVISLVFNVGLGDCGTNPASMILLAGQSCELEFTMSPFGNVGNLSFVVNLSNVSAASFQPIRLVGEAVEQPLFLDRFEWQP